MITEAPQRRKYSKPRANQSCISDYRDQISVVKSKIRLETKKKVLSPYQNQIEAHWYLELAANELEKLSFD